MRKRWPVAGMVAIAVALGSCSDGPAAPHGGGFAVASVLPAHGATGVDPAAPIVLTFTHAMMPAMERYMAIHEGDAAGPVVAGQWSWSDEYRRLTFTPGSPLKAQMTYVIHAGMVHDAAHMDGGHSQHHGTMGTDHARCGPAGGMRSGSMMAGSMKDCTMQASFTTA
jgi:hypothetical protein